MSTFGQEPLEILSAMSAAAERRATALTPTERDDWYQANIGCRILENDPECTPEEHIFLVASGMLLVEASNYMDADLELILSELDDVLCGPSIH